MDSDGMPHPSPISAEAAPLYIDACEAIAATLCRDLDDVHAPMFPPRYYAETERFGCVITRSMIGADLGGGDCGESTPRGPTDRATKERLQGASRRRYGCPRDQMPYTGPNYLAGWDEEDHRLGLGVIEVPPVRVPDCDDTRTIDADVLGYLEEITDTVAMSTQPRRCTLCSVAILPHTRRAIWSWANDNDENLVLHAHRGCDAIRREIDLDEWHEGDLLDRLVQWAKSDRLNYDLGELDAGLTAEERADQGGEIIAAAIRAVLEDEQADVDAQDRV